MCLNEKEMTGQQGLVICRHSGLRFSVKWCLIEPESSLEGVHIVHALKKKLSLKAQPQCFRIPSERTYSCEGEGLSSPSLWTGIPREHWQEYGPETIGNAKEIVLKAQILAGGRGKGVFNSGLKGGVHLTKDPNVVGQLAKQMIGYNLATKQTPKEGVKVNKVMVAEALDISRETYLAILMDRSCNGPVLVGSPQGGVDIEEVAASNPELIFKEQIDIFEGIKDSQAQRMAENLGFVGPLKSQAADQITKLYNLFLKIDATQVEVNPFGETPEGQVVCFDAKINFDDNAEFRQKDIFAMDDKSENEPIENEAAKYDLKYIGLDGNIACFVNGAGLAMATCDIIFLNGGKPANFLDLGGGVKEAQVYQAFKLLTADPKVEAILVNIFGGIVNCAIIANGITKACRELELKVPLVVRLEGTNVQEAQKILNNSGLPITSAVDLEDAAKKAVASVAKK
ncbi:succinate--CoA ligase [GDP-forming] subunit beta, mitochondrial [Rhinopithecus roxellana]|uniref:succinate--CoA ligase [GDP-forming] subunit beta, mitochondrial n=1 Tax=Rhinopithecus roxellana TaxID=61622 RepID=UPI00123725E7|nr:succinate--CoA ligase [GDP-forming] subunit beta, mitochondrial [Rhinopithecus roxellana]